MEGSLTLTRVISDLHIHSKYSRATSEKMVIEEITRFARIKGLNLVGTGDFTHPRWLKKLSEDLVEVSDTGLYKPAKDPDSPVHYMITGEVSTIFTFEGKVKKIHHVILTPSLEAAVQVNDRLARYGNLTVDGRPILNMTAPQLVEEIMGVSDENMIVPSHAWTPWFSIFGAFSGFDRVEDCYQDMTKHIPALETGLSCYDEETEVLTENGWKKFPEIEKHDKVATINPKNFRLEYQKPTNYFSYYYRGKMFSQKGKSIDLLVTPNHKMWVKRRRGKEYEFIGAENLPKNVRYKTNAKWEGRERKWFVLPSVYEDRHRNKIKEKKILMDDWLEFLGYFLSEGNINYSHRSYRIKISQRKNIIREKIKDCIKRLGFHFSEDRDNTVISNKQLFEYLKQFKKDKERFIPREILKLPSRQLKILFNALMDGDGSFSKGWAYSTSSKKLADDFQELLLKIGYSGSISNSRGDECIVSINRKTTTPLLNCGQRYDGRSWMDYEGKVYCIEVPNHTLYVRRKGKACWCGNSDPPMNWRLSALDEYALVSNSDSHSAWPWRIGREANVFELERLTYQEVVDAIRRKDPERFKFTIETDPAYGKYHWTGHRDCNVSLSPQEAIKFGNRCPVCRKRLTKGVEQRVEELADRPMGFRPEGAIGYMHLLPLSEIIATVLGATYPGTQRVWSVYNPLVARFGDEYTVLIDAPKQEMSKVVDPKIAEAIIRVREGKVRVTPGYDGIYGQLVIFEEGEEEPLERVKQRSITNFM